MQGRAERSFPCRYHAAAFVAGAPALEERTIYRYVVNVDPAPRKMADPEVAALLQDPLATLLLRRGVFPQTLRELLAAIDRTGALPVQRSFLVGDGGRIPFRAGPAVKRELRFAIARGTASEAELMVSSGVDPDTSDGFLQVLAWDQVNEVYNYYQRQEPAWLWSGSSHEALEEPSRGHGCFDSHVNGSLVMKELKAPWNNWHSQSAAIEDAVGPADPLRGEQLFQDRQGAQDLERLVVRPGIARWNAARIRARVGADGSVARVRHFLRQVLETTTVNFATSDQESALVRDDDAVRVPLTFFLSSDSLIDVIGLGPNVSRPTVSGRLYRRSLAAFGFELTDGSYRQAGDTHFAFLIPEPAFEDVDLLDKLLGAGVLSRPMAAALLMVDFQNPVYSLRRAALMRHVPEEFHPTPGTPDLSTAVAEAIAAAAPATPAASPEREVLAYIALGDEWEAAMARRIERYLAAVQRRLDTEEGFFDLVRLAESRRRAFRRHPLNEFRLTLPQTRIPDDAASLALCEDGTVAEMPDRGGGPS
jgi:hypothetical protein